MSITFQGEAVSVSGSFPQAGQAAPNFTLCSAELADITLESMKGQKLVLNIFPSIDTPVCAASVREFHQKLASVEGVAVLNISQICHLQRAVSAHLSLSIQYKTFLSSALQHSLKTTV